MPRPLVTLDAAFEVVLGVALAAAAAGGLLDGSDFPWPVGRVLLVIVGVALVLLGAAIRRGLVPLATLAVGNASAAAAGIAWLLLVSGFSAAGTTVLAVTVGGLAGLAAAQAATLRA